MHTFAHENWSRNPRAFILNNGTLRSREAVESLAQAPHRSSELAGPHCERPGDPSSLTPCCPAGPAGLERHRCGFSRHLLPGSHRASNGDDFRCASAGAPVPTCVARGPGASGEGSRPYTIWRRPSPVLRMQVLRSSRKTCSMPGHCLLNQSFKSGLHVICRCSSRPWRDAPRLRLPEAAADPGCGRQTDRQYPRRGWVDCPRPRARRRLHRAAPAHTTLRSGMHRVQGHHPPFDQGGRDERFKRYSPHAASHRRYTARAPFPS